MKRATIRVKEWKVDQINNECHKYNWGVCQADNNDGTCNLYLTEPILKETEKAIYVSVEAHTYGESYREFKTWIPKSCIVAA